MLNQMVSPVVANCWFHHNATCADPDCAGGAIYNGFSDAIIQDCVFSFNSAASGGAVTSLGGNPTFTGCTFDHNSAAPYSGGAVYNSGGEPTFEGCVFQWNTAQMNGGAVVDYGSEAAFTSCLFDSNSATGGSGGGIFNYEVATTTIDDSWFQNNSAGNAGGGIGIAGGADVAVTGSSMVSNEASSGGGVHCDLSTFTLENCELVGNEPHEVGTIFVDGLISSCTMTGWGATIPTSGINNTGMADIEVTNTIIWGYDDLPISSNASTLPNVHHSLIQGSFPGVDILSTDPLFVDLSSADASLQPGSPCIDSGDGLTAPLLDHDGNPRVDDPGAPNTGNGPPWIDIGAHEYWP